MLFKILFILLGLAVGACQFWLLKKITDRILTSEKGAVGTAAYVVIKLALYAVFAALMLLPFKSYLLYAGIAFGAGLILCALFYFIFINYTSKKNGR